MSQLPYPAHMHWKLPNWLRRLYTSGAPTARAASNYEHKLMAAHSRSILWGLQPPSFQPISFRYASGEAIASSQRLLDYGLCHLREDVIAAQRFELTAMVRGLLEAQLRVRVAYTLGYVCQDEHRLCYTPIEGLEQMLRTGIAPGSRVSLHAWLTLPSHEILDPTFWAVFPAYSQADERQAGGLFLHPDQMQGRSYHPQWVGEGFVRKIGVLKE